MTLRLSGATTKSTRNNMKGRKNMKTRKITALIAAAVIALSACSGANTSAPAPETEAPVTTAATTKATTTTAAATKATTTAAKTTVPETTAPPAPKYDYSEMSQAYTELFRGYTFQEVYEYLTNEEGVPSSMIRYVSTPDEDITDATMWSVDRTDISEEKIVLYVSKLSKAAYIQKALPGMRYDEAYDLLINNGASSETINAQNNGLFGVMVKRNWSVQEAVVAEKDGVLYADLVLSHEKSVGNAIFKSIIEQKIDNYSDEHPLLGGALKGIFSTFSE